MLVSEAVVVGLLAGVVGVIAALAAAATVDFYAANEIPDFPFKPDSFFEFSPWLIAAMLALAIGACILGAIPPAIRAASGDPSDALAGR
jgi:ABC-type antimicrobial peptide transport system permease subunit